MLLIYATFLYVQSRFIFIPDQYDPIPHHSPAFLVLQWQAFSIPCRLNVCERCKKEAK